MNICLEKNVWDNCPVEEKKEEKTYSNEWHYSIKADILLSNIYRGFQKALD